MQSQAAIGVLIVSSGRSECGYEIVFSNLNEHEFVDFDGLPLLERRQRKQGSQS